MIKISKGDWQEIYYALKYKQTSPAVEGDATWLEQLKDIVKKIGPDGDRASKLGVSPGGGPRTPSACSNERSVPLDDGSMMIGRDKENNLSHVRVVDDDGVEVAVWLPDEDLAAKVMYLVFEGVASLKQQQQIG